MKKHDQLKQQFFAHLGQQLKAARLTQGLTLEQAARCTGYGRERIIRIENGYPQYLGNIRTGELMGLFMLYGKKPRMMWDDLSLEDKPHQLSAYTTEELKQVIEQRCSE